MKMLDSVKEGYDVKLKKETDQAWEFVWVQSNFIAMYAHASASASA